MSYLDTAIVIAWPECTARGDESILILLRKAGIVKNLNMRVGHAAICLINPQTAEVLYYDFGRYITPRGYGRARSKYTDPTLVLETRATFDEDKNLTNVEDIAQELDAKSKYTHGAGPMVFSVSKTINFAKAKAYADEMVIRGYFPYNGLDKSASNCARYVTETMKAANEDGTVGSKLKYPLTVRPTPLYNVVAASTEDSIYSFEGGTLQFMQKSRRHSIADITSGLLESSFTKYTDSRPDDSIHGEIEEPARPSSLPQSAKWLGGLGEGAWFHINKIGPHSFKGIKYDKTGVIEFEGTYSNDDIELPENPEATYASHCGFFSIEVDGVIHRFYRK
ncbi:MAG: Uncharacterised protein [Cryomorphaceae bacterium]|nr:hypothetical protein [Cryomorphaceae bacterium]CAI8156855.1 MAG: Uncharacterised protein [Cryomorphaceae bacterium]